MSELHALGVLTNSSASGLALVLKQVFGFRKVHYSEEGTTGRAKFSEEQIALALRQHEGSTPVTDVCRQIGANEATFCIWKKKCANLGVSELRELRSRRACTPGATTFWLPADPRDASSRRLESESQTCSPSVSVAQALECWVAEHGAPTSITVDHGTKFTSKALETRACLTYRLMVFETNFLQMKLVRVFSMAYNNYGP